MKIKRNRSLITISCSISGVLGIIDFYLNWISEMKIIDFIPDHIITIIGAIGILLLGFLWIYWKISDFLDEQKNEITKLNQDNKKLIDYINTCNKDIGDAINNHAEWLNVKVDRKIKSPEHPSFLIPIEISSPKKIDINEYH